MAGIPVIKKSRKSRRIDSKIAKSYRGKDLDVTIKTADKSYIRVPGLVDNPTKLRIIDAHSRKIITDKMYDFLITFGARSDGLTSIDIVMVVPYSMVHEDLVDSVDGIMGLSPLPEPEPMFNPLSMVKGKSG